MQTLYTVSTLETIKPGEPQRVLQKHFDLSKDLFQYFVFFVSEIASYAETDSYFRGGKHLPSHGDLNVSTKIAGNQLLWKVKEDEALRKEWGQSKPELTIDKDIVRRIYQKLAATDQYKKYIASAERDKKSEKDILVFIFEELMMEDESLISHIEEHYSNWDDDSDMVIPLVKGYLQKPGSVEVDQFVPLDKLQFARSLLSTVIEKNEHLESLIFPKLKNWDSERIAALDMILMKMGVAELLYFETIPPKVSINEYIELAKEYSTEQSGHFVNGILDNIHKELVEEGKLNKTEFKKN